MPAWGNQKGQGHREHLLDCVHLSLVHICEMELQTRVYCPSIRYITDMLVNGRVWAGTLPILLLSLGTSVKQSQRALMELISGSSGGSEAPGLTGWLLLAVNQVTFSFWIVCWHCVPPLHGGSVWGPALLSLRVLSLQELLALSPYPFREYQGGGEPIRGVTCQQAERPIYPALQPLPTHPTAPAG